MRQGGVALRLSLLTLHREKSPPRQAQGVSQGPTANHSLLPGLRFALGEFIHQSFCTQGSTEGSLVSAPPSAGDL